MPKCYIAIKLDPMDAIKGHIPAIEDCYPCALCSDTAAAIDYLKENEPVTSYPALAGKLNVPAVDVMLTYNTKYPVPEGISDYSTHIMTQMQGEPVNHMISIAADKIFGTMSFSSENLEDSMDKLGHVIRQRLEIGVQLEQAQALHPSCDGLEQWFKHIAEYDPECDGLFPENEVHVQAYVAEYYRVREANPQAGSEVVILQAEIAAAREVAKNYPEWAEEFQCVEATALEELEVRCAQELTFFEPTDYLTRMLTKVPQQFQESFLNVFNETFANIQESHPEWTTEQQSAHAMDQTAYLMENMIVDKQMEGVFGQGPKMSREEYLSLDHDKNEIIRLSAEAHANVALVNHMVAQIHNLDERTDLDERFEE